MKTEEESPMQIWGIGRLILRQELPVDGLI